VGRDGREVGTVDLPLDRWDLVDISPDGRHAAVLKNTSNGGNDLWVVDLERGVANRITMGQGTSSIGTWSPDSKRLLYGSNRRGPRDIYLRAADGSGADEVFYQSNVPFKDATDWSPDGKWVVMNELGGENGWNILVRPATGGPPTTFLATPFNEQYGQISPDGKWMLYFSDETGSAQAFVQSFPTPGEKQQVSKTGAFYGTWAANGREIFLFRTDFSIMSVPVVPGPELRFGAPRELYRLPQDTRSWAPAPDGQRFLVTEPAVRTVPGISIAVNWRAGREE
jgi:Tol biopolymer transport system component